MKFIWGALLIGILFLTGAPLAHAQNTPVASGSSADGAQSFLNNQLIPRCIADPESVRTAGANCITDSITHFTSLLLFLVAIGAFVYLLYGAFLYASTFGDDSKATQAKKTITNALIGVILASLAYTIMYFVRQAIL